MEGATAAPGGGDQRPGSGVYVPGPGYYMPPPPVYYGYYDPHSSRRRRRGSSSPSSSSSDEEYASSDVLELERKLLAYETKYGEIDGESPAYDEEEDVLGLNMLRRQLLRIKNSSVGQEVLNFAPLAEQWAFLLTLAAFQTILVVLWAVWVDYIDHEDEAAEDNFFYEFYRDVSVMIFFGFGFLMTFIRRFGFSAIGYTIVFSALTIQWSVLLGFAFKSWEATGDGVNFNETKHVEVLDLLEGLFCSAAVLISYGACLGKVTPVQLLILAILEPVFYWINFYIGALRLDAHDVGGGMFIHSFGAYFGLVCTWFLTSFGTRAHKDNTSSYVSDLLALAGSIFLYVMWPSFNAAVAAPSSNWDDVLAGADEWGWGTAMGQNRAFINTILALSGATVATFIFSPMSLHGKFDVVHVQNAILAGGVIMGTAGDLDLGRPVVAILCGVLAGAVATLGYRFLTPSLNRFIFLQDVCGVNNLHGMPGVLGALVTVFATLGLARTKTEGQAAFPRGYDQWAFNLAALGVTLGIAVTGGLITGFTMFLAKLVFPMRSVNWFNDRPFWETGSDYDAVVAPATEVTRKKKRKTKALVKEAVRTAVEKARKAASKKKKEKGKSSSSGDVEMSDMKKKDEERDVEEIEVEYESDEIPESKSEEEFDDENDND